LAASAQFLDAVSDLGRSSETSLRHEEAKVLSRGSVDEQDGGMIGRVTFLYYVGWDGFPLVVFQVLPLVWAILTNPETGLEYVAVAAAGLVGKTESMLCGRVHFLLVEPFVMRHRRIVRISTDGKQKKNTECRQYAIERFHGSLRYGLSLILASANHTNFPAFNQARF
jgi:hypothetical protein